MSPERVVTVRVTEDELARIQAAFPEGTDFQKPRNYNLLSELLHTSTLIPLDDRTTYRFEVVAQDIVDVLPRATKHVETDDQGSVRELSKKEVERRASGEPEPQPAPAPEPEPEPKEWRKETEPSYLR